MQEQEKKKKSQGYKVSSVGTVSTLLITNENSLTILLSYTS